VGIAGELAGGAMARERGNTVRASARSMTFRILAQHIHTAYDAPLLLPDGQGRESSSVDRTDRRGGASSRGKLGPAAGVHAGARGIDEHAIVALGHVTGRSSSRRQTWLGDSRIEQARLRNVPVFAVLVGGVTAPESTASARSAALLPRPARRERSHRAGRPARAMTCALFLSRCPRGNASSGSPCRMRMARGDRTELGVAQARRAARESRPIFAEAHAQTHRWGAR
jgi:hypothetical protein